MIESLTFDRLLELITELNACNEGDFNFVLCGDMNAHISYSPDYVIDDTFIKF